MTDKTPLEDFYATLNEVKNFIGLLAPDMLSMYDGDPDDNRQDKRCAIIDILDGGYMRDLQKQIEDNYDIKIAEKFGGTEGDGETHWFVFQHKDKFFRLPGFYDSYSDNEYYWEAIREVAPKEKLVTVFEDI
jgi:hypothetical protein